MRLNTFTATFCYFIFSFFSQLGNDKYVINQVFKITNEKFEFEPLWRVMREAFLGFICGSGL